MKRTIPYLIIVAAASCFPLSIYAGEGHDHGDHEHTDAQEKKGDHAGHDHRDHAAHNHHGHDHANVIAGPNGGRVLTKIDPHLEFLVQEDGRIQISALDADGQVIPVTDQEVKVYTGDRSNPMSLRFTVEEGVLMSDVSLPEGNHFPVVVRIQTDEPGSRVTEKFTLNLDACITCPNREYACTCDHH